MTGNPTSQLDPRTIALLTARLEVALDPAIDELPDLRPVFGDTISQAELIELLIEMTDVAGGALIAIGRDTGQTVWELVAIVGRAGV